MTPEWRAARSAKELARQRTHLGAGNCRSCGKKRGASTNYCDACLVRNRVRNRAKAGYAKWKAGKPGRPPLVARSK